MGLTSKPNGDGDETAPGAEAEGPASGDAAVGGGGGRTPVAAQVDPVAGVRVEAVREAAVVLGVAVGPAADRTTTSVTD
jgi:hypothetical protein